MRVNYDECIGPSATASGKTLSRANNREADAALVCADRPDVSFCFLSLLLSKQHSCCFQLYFCPSDSPLWSRCICTSEESGGKSMKSCSQC